MDLKNWSEDVEEIYQRSLEVFEIRKNAVKWLNSPLGILNNKTPLEYAYINGKEEILNILGRIEHGVFS